MDSCQMLQLLAGQDVGTGGIYVEARGALTLRLHWRVGSGAREGKHTHTHIHIQEHKATHRNTHTHIEEHKCKCCTRPLAT